MSGHDVRVLQDYLTIAGYPTSIDGDYGPATKTNVLAFQRAQGFSANGVVTVTVEKALRAVVAKADAAPATGTTRINSDGTATAPAGAPSVVQEAVAAANQIIDTSYCYAGGHGSWKSSCYDCSGAVGYVLHGAGLLSSPEPSGTMESYGSPGPGKWITIYADSGHAFMVIGGRAFDTADYGGPNVPSGTGPRWRYQPHGQPGRRRELHRPPPDGLLARATAAARRRHHRLNGAPHRGAPSLAGAITGDLGSVHVRAW